MENSYIWSINGCEFEIDMEDADTAERYISALKVLENSQKYFTWSILNTSERIFVTNRRITENRSTLKLFSFIPLSNISILISGARYNISEDIIVRSSVTR